MTFRSTRAPRRGLRRAVVFSSGGASAPTWRRARRSSPWHVAFRVFGDGASPGTSVRGGTDRQVAAADTPRPLHAHRDRYLPRTPCRRQNLTRSGERPSCRGCIAPRPTCYLYPVMRVLILYETRRGFTLTVARAIRDELRLEVRTPRPHPSARSIRGRSPPRMPSSWVPGCRVWCSRASGPPREPSGASRPSRPATDLRRGHVLHLRRRTAPIARSPRDHLGDRGARVVGGFAFKRKKSLRHVPAYVDAVLPALREAPAADGRLSHRAGRRWEDGAAWTGSYAPPC